MLESMGLAGAGRSPQGAVGERRRSAGVGAVSVGAVPDPELVAGSARGRCRRSSFTQVKVDVGVT